MSVAEDFGGMVPRGGWLPRARAKPPATAPAALVIQAVAGSFRRITPDVDVSAFELDIDAPGGGKRLTELRSFRHDVANDCRFPMRGAVGADLRFCGQETAVGVSWCERCTGLAVVASRVTAAARHGDGR